MKTHKHCVHLPTGSCISPILSFLANRRLFDSVKSLCDRDGCNFTLYVDDITISGKNASRELLTRIAMEIHKHGYGYHKMRIYHGAPALVTGVIVADDRLKLPYERAKKIRELSHAIKYTSEKLRPKFLASLVGRLSEAEQINPAYKVLRKRVMFNYAAEWKKVVLSRSKKPKSKYKVVLEEPRV